jgi:hypothetical protein
MTEQYTVIGISDQRENDQEKGVPFSIPAGLSVMIHVEATIPNGAEFISLGVVELSHATEAIPVSAGTWGPRLVLEEKSWSFLPDSERRRSAVGAFNQAVTNYQFDAVAAGDMGLRKIDAGLGKDFLQREGLCTNVQSSSIRRVIITSLSFPPSRK